MRVKIQNFMAIFSVAVMAVPPSSAAAENIKTVSKRVSVPALPQEGVSCDRVNSDVRRAAREACARVRTEIAGPLVGWPRCKVSLELPPSWQGRSCQALAKWETRPAR